MKKAKIRSEIAHKELSDSTRSALCYAAGLKPVVRLFELADPDQVSIEKGGRMRADERVIIGLQVVRLKCARENT
jgi:hypothetical protein